MFRSERRKLSPWFLAVFALAMIAVAITNPKQRREAKPVGIYQANLGLVSDKNEVVKRMRQYEDKVRLSLYLAGILSPEIGDHFIYRSNEFQAMVLEYNQAFDAIKADERIKKSESGECVTQ